MLLQGDSVMEGELADTYTVVCWNEEPALPGYGHWLPTGREFYDLASAQDFADYMTAGGYPAEIRFIGEVYHDND